MNIVSNHNRLLRGAAIPTAGGDVYNSGWEYTPEGEISGYSGSAIYTGEGCQCDSAAIVDSAFNKSTAWVDEQGYLTAHQEVTNLPYVQNSALAYNGVLVSSISGSGLFAESSLNSFYADSAGYAYNAEHADSADYARSSYTAQYANSATSSLNAEVANVSYTALTAHFLDQGWEHDEDGFITAYNSSAFAGAGGGGRYEGISPIVVNNEEMRISAKSALLGVQEPLYFVEDSETATVIGIQESAISGQGIEYSGIAPIVVDNENHLISAQSAKLGVQGPLYFVEDTLTSTVIGIDNSAFPTFETNSEGEVSSINGSAIYATDVVEYSGSDNIDITNHVISVTGSVPSADRADYAVSATSSHYSHSAIEAASANSATYDNLGREITATYLTAVTGDNTPYTQGPNIDITNHVVSGKDWTTEIQAASANAVAQIPDVTNLPYVQNTALESNGILISAISGSGLYATSAENAFEADHSYEADYVLSGWEYDDEDRISAYNGSAFVVTGVGKVYDGIAPIVVNNDEDKISANTIELSAGSGIDITEIANKVIISCTAEGGEGKVYTGVAPIVVDNSQTTGVVSAQTASLGVQSPLYFVTDTSAQTVIGISGLPEVAGLMYESALGLSAGTITGYNNSAFGGGGVQSDWTETATTNLAYIKHKPSEYNLIAGQNVTFTLAGNDLTIDAIGGGSTISYTTGSI